MGMRVPDKKTVPVRFSYPVIYLLKKAGGKDNEFAEWKHQADLSQVFGHCADSILQAYQTFRIFVYAVIFYKIGGHFFTRISMPKLQSPEIHDILAA